MENIAFCIYNIEISWRTIIIIVGVIAAYFLMFGLVPKEYPRCSVVISVPFAIVFSVIMARLIHYYCNTLQYASFKTALTDLSTGNFCFSGVVLGCLLAIGLTKLLYKKSSFRLLSALYSIGLCPVLTIIRLSCLYCNDCRGKLVITNEKFFGLPFSTEIILETGSIGYYLALFLFNAILLGVILVISLCFWSGINRRSEKDSRFGYSALFTLSFMSAVEIITDSIRFDKSFFRSNGFVSHGEIFYGAIMLVIFVILAVRLFKTYGFKVRFIFLCAGFLAFLGGAGALEYFVQRHGDLFFPLYSGMFVCLLADAVMNALICRKLAAE